MKGLNRLCATAVLAVLFTGWAWSLESEVRIVGGKPALFVNGVQKSLILASPYREGPRDFNTFLTAGIEIFNFYVRFPWTGPEEWDFSGVDGKLEAYLAINKDALFLPRILLTPGPWFGELYPDEITMRDDGTPAGMFGRGPHPSFASETYRNLSRKLMTEFISHLEEKFGKNIVGYQVGNGFGGEWLPFNSFWEIRNDQPRPTKFGVEDYSPASVKAFRTWLRKKYRDDVEALKQAWGDPRVTFENATAPGEVERYSTSKGIFFDPAVSSRVPDFLLYYNDSVADVLLENAAWVKEITGRRKVVGSFFGAIWLNFPNLSSNKAGQLALTRVLRSPDIDFICSPYTYDNKYVGGPHNAQSLPEAAGMHGKFYFSETDTETHLTQRQWRWGDSLNNPTTWEQTRGLLIRDFSYCFTKGFGLWWTDLFGGTFDDPRITGLMRRLKSVDEANLTTDKSSTAEIAVILDEPSFTYCGDGEPIFNAWLTAQKQWELGFMGMPWEPHLLSDIDNPALKDFKFYIFLNTIRVSAEQRAAIHARLRRNGATALWVYAPGYIDSACDVANISLLTGIGLAEDMSPGELHIDITNTAHPFTRDLPTGLAYGTDVRVDEIIRYYDHQIYLKDPRDPGLHRDLPGFRVSPRFHVRDPQASVLGTLGAGLDKPGLAVKKQDGWTSIYSAAPIVPAALLRGIAREAGVHIYSDADDVVVANERFLGIYAPKGGTRTVRLPRKTTVVDVLEGKTLAEKTTEFVLELKENEGILLELKHGTAAAGESVLESRYAASDPDLTADPDSEFWKDAPSVPLNRHIVSGDIMAELKAEVRSRWTDRHLHFLFIGKFETIRTKPDTDLTEETYRLWMWDCFEAYVDWVDGPPHRYREFQMSPRGEWLDLDIDATRERIGQGDERLWNSGMTVKARIDEENKIWTGEMRIPWAAIMSRTPRTGDEIPVNFYRQDGAPAEGPGKAGGRSFMAWRPTGRWNPHSPDKFGILRLVPDTDKGEF